MTLRQYLSKEGQYLYKCKLGDWLVKNICDRGTFNNKKYYTDEEVLRVCADIPNTIPLEEYMKDSIKGAMVASDAYIECIRKLGITPVIEEIIYERLKRYEGYTTTKRDPLYKCLTQADKERHVMSVEKHIADLCVHAELMAAPPSYGCNLRVEKTKDSPDGLWTEFTIRDCRAWPYSFMQLWGMTPDSMEKYIYEKRMPTYDPKTGRKRTEAEREAFLRDREEREKKYYEETHPPRMDEFWIPIPCPYYYDKNDRAIPIDSLDDWGHPIYIIKDGKKQWIQPEKKDYSEHKRIEFEVALEKYNKIHDQMIADGALEKLHYDDVRVCLNKLREAIENRANDDAISELTKEFIAEIEASQNVIVNLNHKAFEPHYYKNLSIQVDNEFDVKYPGYNRRLFDETEPVKDDPIKNIEDIEEQCERTSEVNATESSEFASEDYDEDEDFDH